MKRLIRKRIYKKVIGEGPHRSVFYKDLPPNLLPDDEVHISRDEGFYSENESWDAQTVLEIYRLVEETDDEYESRIKKEQQRKEWNKKRRYEIYLNLKKEFDK